MLYYVVLCYAIGTRTIAGKVFYTIMGIIL